MVTAFYTNILPYCDRLQDFLMTMWQNAIKAASNEPDIELPCDIESFDITLYGTLESGVICIAIPNCQESRDWHSDCFPYNTATSRLLYLRIWNKPTQQ